MNSLQVGDRVLVTHQNGETHEGVIAYFTGRLPCVHSIGKCKWPNTFYLPSELTLIERPVQRYTQLPLFEAA